MAPIPLRTNCILSWSLEISCLDHDFTPFPCVGTIDCVDMLFRSNMIEDIFPLRAIVDDFARRLSSLTPNAPFPFALAGALDERVEPCLASGRFRVDEECLSEESSFALE